MGLFSCIMQQPKNSRRKIMSNKEIVQKVNDAFADNKTGVFLSFCSDDVEWTMVGDKTFKGINAIKEFMSSMEGEEPPTFTVDEIIADGDSVACYGSMKMAGKDGKLADYSFCDIYRFNSGKIVKLQSFIVKHKTEGESSEKAAA
jgi:ketosteroid isomerase-like protein